MSSSYSDPATIDNFSAAHSLDELLATRLTRRQVLRGASLLPLLGFPLGCATTGRAGDAGEIGFSAINASIEDRVRVPEGYRTSVLYRWGDATGLAEGMPAFKSDAGNTAAEQALQAGMHHDGMHYFPLPYGSANSNRGLLVMNHEYTDDGLLHSGRLRQLERREGAQGAARAWRVGDRGRGTRRTMAVVRPSRYARRITATTPMRDLRALPPATP